jgi:hypothetical protein
MKRKASLILTAGSIIFSGAFLLLSLNYANNVGLFYTKSSMPAMYFANQMEAVVSGVYASPEESTITYSGPRSCRWDSNNLEYVCNGGATISNVGATIGFTQNQIAVGFPFTACVYVDFLGMAWNKYKSNKKVVKEAAEKAGNTGLEETGEDFLQDAEKLVEENAEKVIEEGVEAGFRKLARDLDIDDFDKFVKNYADDLAEKRAIRQLEESGRMNLRELQSIKEMESAKIQETIWDSIRSNKWDPEYVGLIDAMTGPPGSAIMDAWDQAAEVAAKQLLGFPVEKELLEKGWVSRGLDWLSSKLSVLNKVKIGKLRLITPYLSCRNDNLAMDLLDIAMNGQIVFEWDHRQFSRSDTFYIGKTGAISLTYNLGGEERDVNKLFAMDGDDMCAAREFLAYNLTQYAPLNFDIVDGGVVIDKKNGLFNTICDESSAYYPIGVPEIAQSVLDACNLPGNGELPPIRVYSTPSKIITKDGTTICEERVKRTSDGKMDGSFKILCFDLSELCNVDLTNFEPVHSKHFEAEGLGNYYKNPGGDIIENRFRIDSPLLGVAGMGPILDVEFPSAPTAPIGITEDKEFYLPSRYDYVEVAIIKDNGVVYLRNINEVNVMGVNFQGVYTEDQLLTGGET